MPPPTPESYLPAFESVPMSMVRGSADGPGPRASRGVVGVTEEGPSPQQYILLPERGLLVQDPASPVFNVLSTFWDARSTRAPIPLSKANHPHLEGRVIDSVHENGPKLVEMNPQEVRNFYRRRTGLRLEPVRYYYPAQPSSAPLNPVPGAAGAPPLDIFVVCAVTGRPIPGAVVTAFVSCSSHVGDCATTDATGRASLRLGVGAVALERLYVRAPVVGFWGAYQSNLTVQSSYSVPLQPVAFPYTDGVRFFYSKSTPIDGQGVRVAVVDTGVGPHPHLRLVEGWNTVRGEPATDFETNGNPHGTHVAGIIASRGDPLGTPAGTWGLAPAVDLVSFRVFGANNGLSTNYSIVKAILYAIRHPTSGLQCDIINLSISGDPVEDPVMLAALQDACDHGILVVAAAGNNYRQPVSPLARYAFQEGVSVSACGRKGTYPAGAYEESHFDPSPAAAQPDDFMAAFTNIGDVSLTAPGVGIISTVPPDGYAPLSGTSMACPVVAGFAARLWSQTPALFHAARDRQRVVNFVNHLNTFAATMGFPFAYEGSGMPR